MVALFVDEYNDDKTIGQTKTIDVVMQDLKLFGEGFYKKFMHDIDKSLFPSETRLLTVGRYLCIIRLSKNKKVGVIFFFDNKNNDDVANDNANALVKSEGIEFAKSFMREYYSNKGFYEKRYYDFEITKNKSSFN